LSCCVDDDDDDDDDGVVVVVVVVVVEDGRYFTGWPYPGRPVPTIVDLRAQY
jgi:hypothetical protein